MELTDRVVIVTGASRGIGKGLAIGLAARGATVVCAARTVAEEAGDLPGTIRDTVAAIEAAAAVRSQCAATSANPTTSNGSSPPPPTPTAGSTS